MLLSLKRRHPRSPLPDHDERGFTLIEMLVVLGIIGLITALVGPQVIGYLGRAKTDTARSEISNISVALDLYRLDVGRYPSNEEGLEALVGRPQSAANWTGPYLRQRRLPADPWERPYVYRQPGKHGPFDLYTLGADNLPGGNGEDQDVANW